MIPRKQRFEWLLSGPKRTTPLAIAGPIQSLARDLNRPDSRCSPLFPDISVLFPNYRGYFQTLLFLHIKADRLFRYSTVTLLARLRG